MNAIVNGMVETAIAGVEASEKYPAPFWTVYVLQVLAAWGGALYLAQGFWSFFGWLMLIAYAIGIPVSLFWRWLSKN